MPAVTATGRRPGKLLLLLALAGVTRMASAAIEISDPTLPHPFGSQPVGSTYATQYFSVFNRGTAPVTLQTPRISGDGLATCSALGCPRIEPEAFTIGDGDGCAGRTLQAGEGCSTLVGFSPRQGGAVTAEIVFATSDGETVRGGLTGTGRHDPADCLWDWAERTYPSILRSPTPSVVVSPFYGRCYADGLCVAADIYAVSVAEPRVYLYQNSTLTPLDTFANYARTAGCSQ